MESPEKNHKNKEINGSPNRFLKPLLIVLVASLVAGAMDTISVIMTSSLAVSAVDWPVRFLYMLPWFVGLAALIFGAIQAVSGPVDRIRKQLRDNFDQWHRRAGVLATMPTFALLITGMYWVVLLSATIFHNHRLGSLLVVLAICCLLLLSLVLWCVCFWCFAHPFRSRVMTWVQKGLRWLALPSLLAAILAILLHNREGLVIVGGWFFAGPIGFVVGAFVAWLILRRRNMTCRPPRFAIALALLASAFVSFAVGSVASDDLVSTITASTTWSARAIHVGRMLTDVDRDGFSSFFGGGDCAPFDSKRSPGTVETVGDGIDNDCYGGDAEQYEFQRPEWHDFGGSPLAIDHVMVVVIEAMRSDAVSSIRGGGPKSTPNIDALAEQGIVFTRMYSSAAATLWSLASLWTTLPPSQIGWKRRPINNKRFLDSDVRLFPEHIKGSGVFTMAFLTHNERMGKGTGIGLDRGFEQYVTMQKQNGFRGHPSASLVSSWKNTFDPSRRSFSYLHFDEPHSPYTRHKSAPDFGQSRRDLYYSDVWMADKQIGAIVAHLRNVGVFDRTVIFATGDHGEAFGEHGRWTHGSNTYEEQVRTFGVMWVPGLKHCRVEMPVSHQDLGSTFMNLLNIRKGFEQLYGLNLVPYMRGIQKTRKSPVITESHVNRGERVALIREHDKLVFLKRTGRGELYDLRNDPGETKNVSKEQPEKYDALMKEMRAYTATQVKYD